MKQLRQYIEESLLDITEEDVRKVKKTKYVEV